MNNAFLPNTSEYQPPKAPLPVYLFEERHEAPFLLWWYRFTLPPAPEVPAPREEQERFRQSRTTSHILLIMLLLYCFLFQLLS